MHYKCLQIFYEYSITTQLGINSIFCHSQTFINACTNPNIHNHILKGLYPHLTITLRQFSNVYHYILNGMISSYTDHLCDSSVKRYNNANVTLQSKSFSCVTIYVIPTVFIIFLINRPNFHYYF